MGRVDQWWNEHFPPFSLRRLAFGVAVIPVTSLLWRFMAADVFTWGRYIGITLVTQLFFAVMYLFARNGREEVVAVQADGTATITWRLPARASDATEPVRPLWEPKKKPLISPYLDLVLTLVISCFTFMMMVFIFVPETPALLGTAMAVATGLVFTVSLIYRNSIPIMLGVCALLGFLVGGIARGLYSVMSFFSDPGPMWLWWVLGSLGVLTFIGPGWMAMRANRQIFERLRVPNCVIATLVCVFLLVMTAMATVEVRTEGAVASVPVPQAPVEEPGEVTFGVPTKDEAILRLFFAWRNGDRDAAAQVVQGDALRQLFALDFDPASRLLGCGVADGAERCVIRRSTDLAVLSAITTPQNRVYLAYFELKPLDYPIDYSPSASEPSPSP
jgi:hypothetical protein